MQSLGETFQMLVRAYIAFTNDGHLLAAQSDINRVHDIIALSGKDAKVEWMDMLPDEYDSLKRHVGIHRSQLTWLFGKDD